MSIRDLLARLFGKRSKPHSRFYELSESLQVSLSTIARHEGRLEHEVLPDLVAAGLDRYRSTDELWRIWESLSPREQDVTALTCLGLTNRQIAVQLYLSPDTIKTHIRNVLYKFALNSKKELRHILAGWDFSAWM
ncbi:MAG: helix-turn-helix transcriptional regulator [Anaerolineales bacterium]